MEKKERGKREGGVGRTASELWVGLEELRRQLPVVHRLRSHVCSEIVLDEGDAQARLVTGQAGVPDGAVPEGEGAGLADEGEGLEAVVVAQREGLVRQRRAPELVASCAASRQPVSPPLRKRGGLRRLEGASSPGTKIVGPSSGPS